MVKPLCILAALAGVCLAADTRFEISCPSAVNAGPVTGRVFVMLSRTNQHEPRTQVGRVGVPFFGRDIEQLAPGQAAVVDGADLGTPVESLAGIPPGDYWVQGFINVYSEFHRADGHVVWMHDDHWEGQRWNRSPGNLYSTPRMVTLDASRGYRIPLVCDQVIPPVEIPVDTEWVKRFKIQSKILTKFWGRPIYLGATVLLPRDYSRTTMSYPVLYEQGHFGLGAPLGFSTGGGPPIRPGQQLATEWMKDDFPRQCLPARDSIKTGMSK